MARKAFVGGFTLSVGGTNNDLLFAQPTTLFVLDNSDDTVETNLGSSGTQVVHTDKPEAIRQRIADLIRDVYGSDVDVYFMDANGKY